MKPSSYAVYIISCVLLCFMHLLVYADVGQLAPVGDQPMFGAIFGQQKHMVGPVGKLRPWEWQTNIALYAVDATYQFDQCGNKTLIEDFVFSEQLFIGNAFLASKLSAEGQLSTTLPYGRTPREQYLAQLSTAHIHFTPDYRERGCLFRAVYRWKPRSWEKVRVQIGTTFAIKQVDHFLDLQFELGRISANSVIMGFPGPNGTVFEDNITQFFTDYSGLFDFFTSAILIPKQLTYYSSQQRTGFGDLGLFVELEVPDPGFFWTSQVNVGAALSLPTGNKATGYILWEIELGNGGAIQLDLYTSINFNKIHWLGTITFAAAIRFSAPFSKSIRIPQIKTNKNELFLPPRFQSYYINTPSGHFYSVDSTSASFADEAVCATTIYGLRGIFTVSDNWNIPRLDATLGVIYQAMIKDIDTIHAPIYGNKQFVPAITEEQTDTISHGITGLIRWKFKRNMQDCEFNIGFEAIVAGQNVLNTHKLFAGFTMSF